MTDVKLFAHEDQKYNQSDHDTLSFLFSVISCFNHHEKDTASPLPKHLLQRRGNFTLQLGR